MNENGVNLRSLFAGSEPVPTRREWSRSELAHWAAADSQAQMPRLLAALCVLAAEAERLCCFLVFARADSYIRVVLKASAAQDDVRQRSYTMLEAQTDAQVATTRAQRAL